MKCFSSMGALDPSPDRTIARLRRGASAGLVAFALALAAPAAEPTESEGNRLPWRAAGWSERQAAAHLLDRLTFGPRPDDVDRVVEMGLERWLEAQLEGNLPEPDLERRLAPLSSLGLSAVEAAERFPTPAMVLRQAVAAGVIREDEIAMVQSRDGLDGNERDAELRRRVVAFAERQGYGSQRQLLGEAMAAKLLAAVYAENQLTEVLTDFWFNHFNVSITDRESRVYVPSFEQDAIRPHVTGRFRDLLGATAKHPAMLLYLDNARSTAEEDRPTTMSRRLDRRLRPHARHRLMDRHREQQRRRPNRSTGLNENYARELLELHTLGVDGGYTQEDVLEVARAFTGWTVVPPRAMMDRSGARLDRALAADIGFERQRGFLFRADAHDEGKKVILGHTFRAGRGLEEGEAVLDLLASHPSTHRHLAAKMAVRFVADEPPESLVERVADVLDRTDGDLGRAVETIAYSPEFWAPEARRQKIKSPFELTASALRALDAEVTNPRSTIRWLGRLGQPLYAYQAPTGYPDRAAFWVNTGALLNRMNFGLELAAGRLDGVEIDLAALAGYREPESPSDALRTYARLLLPERDLGETVRRLGPMLRDPELAERLEAAVDEDTEPTPDPFAGEMDLADERSGEGDSYWRDAHDHHDHAALGPPSAVEQVVGLILGSPEFQRR